MPTITEKKIDSNTLEITKSDVYIIGRASIEVRLAKLKAEVTRIEAQIALLDK